jgi:hypothetical protein
LAAGQAFRDICTACDDYVAHSAALDPLIAAAAHGFDSLAGPKIAEGLVRAVVRCAPETVAARLVAIAQPIVDRISGCDPGAGAAVGGDNIGGAGRAATKRAATCVDAIAAVLEQVEDCILPGIGSAVVPVVKLAWPSLTKVTHAFRGEHQVMYRVANALGCALESGGPAMFPMIPTILELAVGSYLADTGAHCWLELLAKITEFEITGEITAMLARATEAITPGVVAQLKGDVLAMPDLLCAYFGVGGILMQLAPTDLMNGAAMPVLFELAQGALACYNESILHAACAFLEGAYRAAAIDSGGAAAGGAGGSTGSSAGKGSNAVVVWLGTGEAAIASLLSAIALTSPQTSVDMVGELLMTLTAVIGPTHMFTMLAAALQSDWFPAPHVPMDARGTFLTKLQTAQTNSSSFRFCWACTDFAKVCRTNK